MEEKIEKLKEYVRKTNASELEQMTIIAALIDIEDNLKEDKK